MRDYRVDITSNFDNETFRESTVISNLTMRQAERIANILNETVDESDPEYYRARHMGERLWLGLEDLV